MAALTSWPCGRGPTIGGSIFNCGRMVMLGGVVVVLSKAYVLSGDGPPSLRSLKRNVEAPLPPCGASSSSRHSLSVD